MCTAQRRPQAVRLLSRAASPALAGIALQRPRSGSVQRPPARRPLGHSIVLKKDNAQLDNKCTTRTATWVKMYAMFVGSGGRSRLDHASPLLR
eukprot:5798219-Alexandrium_andersonii.AAC.1